MKENRGRMDYLSTVANGESKLLHVQSQRLLSSLIKLAHNIDSVAQPRVQKFEERPLLWQEKRN